MCTLPDLVPLLLPDSAQLDVTTVEFDPDERQLTVAVSSVQGQATCPCCQTLATRIHSHYIRTLADLPWADCTVRLHLTVRKWFCRTAHCARRIFTERLPTIVMPWARRTRRLAVRQQELGLALGGRAGTRLAALLDQPVSRATLIRFVRQTPEAVVPIPQHLGVDDFALRKGQTYGTILVDLDTGCPIDVLADRSAATLAAWLRAHPGVELISRDRAGAYAEGASQGAPEAVQVADRWHLLRNLGDALSRLFAAHPAARGTPPAPAQAAAHQALADDLLPGDPGGGGDAAPTPPAPAVPAAPPTKADRARQQCQERRQTRYAQIQALLQQGVSLRAIAEQLDLSRGMVCKYARATTAPTAQPRAQRRSLLDPYKPYLLERWNAGCHVGTELLREIEACGYQGGRSIALAFIAAIRKQQGIAPLKRTGLPPQAATDPTVQPLSPRELAWLVLKRPDQVDMADQTRLEQVRQANPQLALAVTLAQEFATMVREREGAGLDSWLAQVESSGLGELKSFAGGIRRDYEAVQAALSLPYSNGVVEGNVNRVKYLKRQMYGRAKFDLLRKRVLYAP